MRCQISLSCMLCIYYISNLIQQLFKVELQLETVMLNFQTLDKKGIKPMSFTNIDLNTRPNCHNEIKNLTFCSNSVKNIPDTTTIQEVLGQRFSSILHGFNKY